MSLFIIDLMGLFFYNKIGSIISIGDLPTTNIIEPKKVAGGLPFVLYSMKIKEQTRKLAAGCSKNCFEVADRTDEVSSKHCFEVVDKTDEVSHIPTARRR